MKPVTPTVLKTPLRCRYMVLCWIALPVFVVLGLFSVRYRKLARESFDCLWRMTTFRPCKSTLDERLRADITGKLMKHTPSLARFFYNNYKLIALMIMIVMITSTYLTGVGVYNYIKYGNCNGENSSAFCIINAAIGEQTPSSIHSNRSALDCFNQTSPFSP